MWHLLGYQFLAKYDQRIISKTVVLLIKTRFLDQVKVKDISYLIKGIFKVLQKLLKCFNGATILTVSFVRSVSVILSTILAL